MINEKNKLIIGALLHDIGKVVYRAKDLQRKKAQNNETEKDSRGTSHGQAGYEFLSFIEDRYWRNSEKIFSEDQIGGLIKYHHKNKMKNNGEDHKDDDLTFLVAIGDHISASERRQEEYLDNKNSKSYYFEPLKPIFTELKDDGKNYYYDTFILEYSKKIPEIKTNNDTKIDKNKDTNKDTNKDKSNDINEDKNKINEKYEKEYNSIIVRLEELFRNNHDLFTNPKNINQLVSIIKVLFKYIPSDTRNDYRKDISLADHCLDTCAYASALYDYLESNNSRNFKSVWKNEKEEVFDKEIFSLLSFRLIGSDNFIFETSVDKAIKNLRSKSFYIQMLSEIFIDSILEKAKLSRANLLFSGKDYGFLIFPNTTKTASIIEDVKKSFNDFLLDNFNSKLLLSIASINVSPTTLSGKNKSLSLKQVFKNLEQIHYKNSLYKHNYYSFIRLNEQSVLGEVSRECSKCGCHKTDNLIQNNDTLVCKICDSFINFSTSIFNQKNKYLVLVLYPLKALKDEPFLIFPYEDKQAFLYALDEDKFLQIKDNIIFSYVKNDFKIFKQYSTNVFFADYQVRGEDGIPLTTSQLSGDEDDEHKKISLLKISVDDILFDKLLDNNLYTSSRLITLHNHLGIYFKHYIQLLIEAKEEDKDNEKEENKSSITIIYSDEKSACLLGKLDHLLNFVTILDDSFKRYTLNTVTFSLALSNFSVKYPMFKMYNYVNNLLYSARNKYDTNSRALFNKDNILTSDDFKNALNDSEESFYGLIKSLIDKKILTNTNLYGQIYKPLKFFDEENYKKVNYKIHYFLGRLRSDKQSLLQSDNLFTKFDSFAAKLIEALDKNKTQQRKMLLASLQIYMYKHRIKNKEIQND